MTESETIHFIIRGLAILLGLSGIVIACKIVFGCYNSEEVACEIKQGGDYIVMLPGRNTSKMKVLEVTEMSVLVEWETKEGKRRYAKERFVR